MSTAPYRGRKPIHYADSEEKETLATDGTELYITAVDHSQGTYGERLEYTLEKANEPGQLFRVAWARSAFRDQDALEIEEQLQVNDRVGPVRLVKVPTRRGRDAWAFESASDETEGGDQSELISLDETRPDDEGDEGDGAS